MLTPDEIAQLRALEQAATPGPWEASNWAVTSDACNICGTTHLCAIHDGGRDTRVNPAEADAALIAATRNALPELLDAAEEAEGLREAHHSMSEQFKVMQREKEHGWHLAEKVEAERNALRDELLVCERASEANAAAHMDALIELRETRAELDALRGRVLAITDEHIDVLTGRGKYPDRANACVCLGCKSRRALDGPA